MSGYTKLYKSIVFSTVWREPNHVRIVWVTLLALADARGVVGASKPGLADAARVSLEECDDALERFKAPDPYSRTPDNDGRRIVEVSGGWKLLNHKQYREGRDPEKRREQNREAQARRRAKLKSESASGHQPSSGVSSRHAPSSGVSQPISRAPDNDVKEVPDIPPESDEKKSAKSQPKVSRCQPDSAQAEAEAQEDQNKPRSFQVSVRSRVASAVPKPTNGRASERGFSEPGEPGGPVYRIPRTPGARPERLEGLLPTSVQVLGWRPNEVFYEYAVELGLDRREAEDALVDLLAKTTRASAPEFWLENKFCRFVEQRALRTALGAPAKTPSAPSVDEYLKALEGK